MTGHRQPGRKRRDFHRSERHCRPRAPARRRKTRVWFPVFHSTNRQLAWSGYGTVLIEPEKPEDVQILPHPPNESGVFIPTRDAHITWLAAVGAEEEVHLFATGSPCRHIDSLGLSGALPQLARQEPAAGVPRTT